MVAAYDGLAIRLVMESWRMFIGDAGEVNSFDCETSGNRYSDESWVDIVAAASGSVFESGERFIIAVACSIAVIRIASYLKSFFVRSLGPRSSDIGRYLVVMSV